MRNLKLTLEYDGTNYCGWQIQSQKSEVRSQKSIQETIEQVLQKILQEKVKLIVSGRTDSGVHALAQAANFKTKNSMPLRRLQWAINGILPKDIIVTKIQIVDLNFNSRFSAKAKIYRYTVLNRAFSSPLLRSRVYFYRYALDIALMRGEAKVLLGRHNFSSFCSADSWGGNPVKNIKSIKIIRDKKNIHIDIEADGFLYNMVRNIVGTLLEIGRGRIKEGSMKKILAAKNRLSAGPLAPASGLCLMKVKF